MKALIELLIAFVLGIVGLEILESIAFNGH
jgi:hypothetical protein